MTIEFPDNSGVNIAGKIPRLHRDSWFEPPLVVQAAIAPMNLIQLDAFTGIYGGKIGHCRIGRYCSIAPGVDIASDQHPTDWLSSSMIQYVPDLHGWGSWLSSRGEKYITPTERFSSNAQVIIGNDVWIGQGVFIKSGVKIGDGAVIAAHSVVIDDVPPYMIAAGVPAKIKKPRFDEVIIERLLELSWWNYNLMEVGELNFRSPMDAVEKIAEAIAMGLKPYQPQKYKIVD
ncbi:CatB-related O-acetyltransferase [Cupriavidus oxalaticus]|uniref:CatB-related O-acetyltransferase n=1 Tax=Cupriavidus oxalaticus TaxID=96344 RepID=A0A4P7L2P7_9BURK|nr:CatB-related O-acetyltransferase [Cupriavidus oxalaticus]QBY49678.1 CatB-related O-acetyltransferase [Cupriavidus oxalaticus]